MICQYKAVMGHVAGVVMAALLCLPGGSRAAQRGFDTVSVAAINYSGRDLNGVLFINPENKNDVAGGPPILPYGGSGGMCCYALPHKWKPGIRVKVRYDWWAGNDAPRDFQFMTVEVPPYPTDEPGTLWALFYEDGTSEVFASAVDPGHPKWPGKLKHWPIPSKEYKLKLWQVDYDKIVNLIPYYKQMEVGLPDEEVQETWDFYKKYSKKLTVGFDGPNDPRFKESLKTIAKQSLEQANAQLSAMESNKP